MWTIYYNNQNPFDGIAPTPVVERSTSFNGDNAPQNVSDVFVIRGVMTGDCSVGNGFAQMNNKREQLLSGFRHQFKNFYISTGDAGSVLYSGDVARVQRISFEESNFYTLAPFSVEVHVYDRSLFTGHNSIVAPSDSYSFSKNDVGLVTIERSISARGIVTNSTALANAANFVNSHTGWGNATPPTGQLAFIEAPTGEPLMLSTRTEIDRLAASYSVVERYQYDPCAFDNSGFFTTEYCPSLRYTVEKNSGVNQDTQVTVRGSIKGGINCAGAGALRSEYALSDWHSVAQTFYNQTETGLLYDKPISESITEDPNQEVLNFNIAFSNTTGNTSGYIKKKYTLSDDCENGEVCISVEGEIFMDQVCHLNPSQARTTARNKYNNFDVRGDLLPVYSGFGYSGSLATKPRSKSLNWDPVSLRMTFNETYCERNDDAPDCLENLEYTMNFTPRLPTYVETAGLDGLGCRIIQDMNCPKRARYSIQGTATVSECCSFDQGIQSLYNFIAEISNNYFSGDNKALLNHNIETGRVATDKNLTFSASWSAEGGDVIPSGLLKCNNS